MEYPHLESWVTELLRRKLGEKTLWISRDAPKKELSKAKIRLWSCEVDAMEDLAHELPEANFVWVIHTIIAPCLLV